LLAALAFVLASALQLASPSPAAAHPHHEARAAAPVKPAADQRPTEAVRPAIVAYRADFNHGAGPSHQAQCPNHCAHDCGAGSLCSSTGCTSLIASGLGFDLVSCALSRLRLPQEKIAAEGASYIIPRPPNRHS
jgi:hypothetical protein